MHITCLIAENARVLSNLPNEQTSCRTLNNQVFTSWLRHESIVIWILLLTYEFNFEFFILGRQKFLLKFSQFFLVFHLWIYQSIYYILKSFFLRVTSKTAWYFSNQNLWITWPSVLFSITTLPLELTLVLMSAEFLRQNCFCKITATATKIVLKVKEAWNNLAISWSSTQTTKKSVMNLKGNFI